MLRPMFLDFYKLREQPFSDTPDPRYVYLSRTHREALASLLYGIETGRGFLALIAEPGMGKTTLLFRLLELLRSSARTAFLFQTQCDSLELLRYLLIDLGIDSEGKSLSWMHEQLKQILIRTASAGKRFVVFIDEAQNLTESVLETVRLLSDFETSHSKLMQIVLAGQPQLADILARPALSQLRQRISILSRLRPFTVEETDAYVRHRLQVAGYGTSDLFTPEARAMIGTWSGGIPRNINNLCFNALSLGYALERQVIGCSVVQEAANDLELSQSFSEGYGPSNIGDSTSISASIEEPVNALDKARVYIAQVAPKSQLGETPVEQLVISTPVLIPASKSASNAPSIPEVSIKSLTTPVLAAAPAYIFRGSIIPRKLIPPAAGIAFMERKREHFSLSLGRTMILLGALVVTSFLAGEAAAYLLDRGASQPSVIREINPPPASSSVSTVEAQGTPHASNPASTASPPGK